MASVLDSLPEPSEELRGCFVIVPNGNTDRLFVCMSINGVYNWVEFNASQQSTSTTSVLGQAVLGMMRLGG